MERLERAIAAAWKIGQPMFVMSVKEGIQRDQATNDLPKICHQLALDHGLPEIRGYYGITEEGEFVYEE